MEYSILFPLSAESGIFYCVLFFSYKQSPQSNVALRRLEIIIFSTDSGNARLHPWEYDTSCQGKQPYPYLWLHTIDEYIVWYCSLAEKYEAQQESIEWHYFTFPSVLANTFENQGSEEITSRKNLNIPAIKKHIISIAETGKISDTVTHKTEKLGAGGYLNYVFRELSVRKDAKNVRSSIDYDGLKYSVVEKNSDPDLPSSEVQEPIPSYMV